MDTEQLEKDTFELPTINPWRQRPSREAVRFAMDLCRSELTGTVRAERLAELTTMSASQTSALIDGLKAVRAARLRKAPRSARWRLAPMGRQR